MSENLNYLAAPQVDDTAGQDFGMPQHYDAAMHEAYPRPLMEGEPTPPVAYQHKEPKSGSKKSHKV